jgi:hypothetical protein
MTIVSSGRLKLKDLEWGRLYNYILHPMSGYGGGTGVFKVEGFGKGGGYLVRLNTSKNVIKVNKKTFLSITDIENTCNGELLKVRYRVQALGVGVDYQSGVLCFIELNTEGGKNNAR